MFRLDSVPTLRKSYNCNSPASALSTAFLFVLSWEGSLQFCCPFHIQLISSSSLARSDSLSSESTYFFSAAATRPSFTICQPPTALRRNRHCGRPKFSPSDCAAYKQNAPGVSLTSTAKVVTPLRVSRSEKDCYAVQYVIWH